MAMVHHSRCPIAQAWDVEGVPCECPAFWPRREKGDYYQTCPQPKPEPRKRTKARRQRVHRGNVTEVRAYVFGRERNICRVCRFRAAESMHELRPKSLRGKVSRTNSVAVCGSGTTGCHGYCQSNQIRYAAGNFGAEGPVIFTPITESAADWLRILPHEQIESLPMQQMEEAI